MKKTYVACSADITNERFNRKVTDSNDQEVHLAYHLRTALYAVIHQMLPCNEMANVVFPITMDISVEILRENMNAKLLVTANVDCPNIYGLKTNREPGLKVK